MALFCTDVLWDRLKLVFEEFNLFFIGTYDVECDERLFYVKNEDLHLKFE